MNIISPEKSVIPLTFEIDCIVEGSTTFLAPSGILSPVIPSPIVTFVTALNPLRYANSESPKYTIKFSTVNPE